MTKKQAEKLMRLHWQGYTVQVAAGYVDGNVREIYGEDGEIVFDSEVYAGASLTTFGTAQIKVSKPLDDWVNQPIG